MSSSVRGNATFSEARVESITPDGVWLFVLEEELFLSFSDYPELREARVSELHHVTLPSRDHLHWPDLDFDLEIDSLRHPERYPLVARRQGG
jgi:hypothetical protein